jgi:hypothetical protein
VIDRSGRWWTGTGPEDLDEYLRSLTADGYPAERFEQARCVCGGTRFLLDVDADEGCARRTCTGCGAEHFLCDSGDFAEDADLRRGRCPCGEAECEVVAGFSHRGDGGIRWITVGRRCAVCGVLGSPVDWKIDYAPAEHLYELV